MPNPEGSSGMPCATTKAPVKILEEMLISLCKRIGDFNNVQGDCIGDIRGIKSRLGTNDTPHDCKNGDIEQQYISPEDIRQRVEEACRLFEDIEANGKTINRELNDIIDIV